MVTILWPHFGPSGCLKACTCACTHVHHLTSDPVTGPTCPLSSCGSCLASLEVKFRCQVKYANYACDVVVRECAAERKSTLGWIQASREREKGKGLTCGSSGGPVSPPHCLLPKVLFQPKIFVYNSSFSKWQMGEGRRARKFCRFPACLSWCNGTTLKLMCKNTSLGLFWLHWVFFTAWAFSSCGKQGLLFAVGCRLLILVASPECGP